MGLEAGDCLSQSEGLGASPGAHVELTCKGKEQVDRHRTFNWVRNRTGAGARPTPLL